MATYEGLTYSRIGADVDGLRFDYAEDGKLSQIVTPAQIILVEESPSLAFVIQRWGMGGENPPLEEWEFSFDSSAQFGGALSITKKVNFQTQRIYKYFHTAPQQLALEVTDGTTPSLRREVITGSVASGTKTLSILDGNGAEVSRTIEEYQPVPGGVRGPLKTKERVFTAASGPELVTERHYWGIWSPLDQPYWSYSEQLKWEKRPDGSWTFYTYDQNDPESSTAARTEAHRPSVVYSSWNDYQIDLDSDTTDGNFYNNLLNNSRSTHYFYGLLNNHADNDNSVFPRRHRRLAEYVPGTVSGATAAVLISDSWFAYRLVSHIGNPGADNLQITEKKNNRIAAIGYDDTSNLTTRTVYFGMDEKRPLEVNFSDGRKDLYGYDTCSLSFSGAGSTPVVTDTGVYHRTRIDHYGSTGALVENKSTREVTIKGLANQVLVEETYVYSGGSWDRISWTAYSYDTYGHVTDTYRSDNTHQHTEWTCCGRVSETDESGIQHIFDPPDILGRVFHSRKVGDTGDGSDDVHTNYNIDLFGRTTSTTKSGGVFSLTSTSSFDWAGRMTSSTDQAGLSTTHQYCTTGTPACVRIEVTRPESTGIVTAITEHYLDGRVKSVTSNPPEAGVARYYEYGIAEIDDDAEIVSGNKILTTWTKVSYGSPTSPRWEKTYVDGLGRQAIVEKSGFASSGQSGAVIRSYTYYDPQGRIRRVSGETFYLTQSGGPGGGISGGNGGPGNIEEGGGGGEGGVPPGSIPHTDAGADVIYDYDEMSLVLRTGTAMNCNRSTGGCQLELAGADRIKETTTQYVKVGSDWWQESANYVYPTVGNGTRTFIGSNRSQLTGFTGALTSLSESIDAAGRVTRSITNNYPTLKTVTTSSVGPASSSTSVSVNGLLRTTYVDGNGSRDIHYDGLGRQVETVDARTGTSITHYDSNGRVGWVRDAAGHQTTYDYDGQTGALKSITNDQNRKTYFEYYPDSQIRRMWGDVPQPIEFVYDADGRRTEIHTYRDSQTAWTNPTWPANATMPDVTRMSYDIATGLLMAKVYPEPDQKATRYEYNTAGALTKRIWARPGNIASTQYQYDPHTGDLTMIDYAASSMTDVTYAYDRLGRRITITDGVGVHSMAYSNLSDDVTETISGTLINKVITRETTYPAPPPGEGSVSTSMIRALKVGTSSDPAADYSAEYRYGILGTLDKVAGPGLSNGRVVYGRLTDSALIESATYESASYQTIASWTRSHEPHRDLITAVDNKWYSSPEQPTTISRYAYVNDSLGRRTSVVRTGSAFEDGHLDVWGYNDRGELTSSARHASTNPQNPQNPDPSQFYAYAYDPIGNRLTSTVSLNQTTTYACNGLNQYSSIQTMPGSATESFPYDEDGNLKEDGAYKYSWDGENRLTSVEPKSPTAASVKLMFDYDYMSRRVRRRVVPRNAGNTSWLTTSPTKDVRFVYDGWNVIMELNGLNGNAVLRKYTWGLDLAGSQPSRDREGVVSPQGAGGIGGLLALHDTQGTATTTDDKDYAYFYDANGNVGQVIDVTASVLQPAILAAKYEYDPYGQSLLDPANAAVSGPYAATNPFRFSTKYCDSELASGTTEDLYYYGYRYYLPRLGRWVSRDPMGEYGGVNLYHYSYNSPVALVDPLGLDPMIGKGRYCNCRKVGYKRVNIASVVTSDNDQSWIPKQRARARDVWNQCCIKIYYPRNSVLDAVETKSRIGSDYKLDLPYPTRNPTKELLNLTVENQNSRGNEAYFYFVPTRQNSDGYVVDGISLHFRGHDTGIFPLAIIFTRDLTKNDTLAHELGHILGLNTTEHDPDVDHLMANGEDRNADSDILTESQCDRARLSLFAR